MARCPICFASANEHYHFHPSLNEIKSMYQIIVDHVHHSVFIHISGGEPTIRDDLPEIVRLGKQKGIDYIEVNTNAMRLANDILFLQRIKEDGIKALCFSFDGLHSDIYIKTCGKEFLEP